MNPSLTPPSPPLEGNPGGVIQSSELFAGKTVLIGVHGAFTPTCSNTHLPQYIQHHAEIAAKGYKIACISVNDPFVMDAWGKSLGADGKVRMLADTHGELAKALGVELQIAPLGGLRSKRFAAVIHDNTVVEMDVEPDGTGATCSLAAPVLAKLK